MKEFEPLTTEKITHLEAIEQQAIERLRMAAQMARKYFDLPLYICISGGKDSSVLQELALRAGIDCVYQHALTTADAPETVYFVRAEFKRLEAAGAKTVIVPPKESMWRMIRNRYGCPPYA